jgi:hypothetical protein
MIHLTVQIFGLKTDVCVEEGKEWRHDVLASLFDDLSAWLSFDDVTRAEVNGRPVQVREAAGRIELADS